MFFTELQPKVWVGVYMAYLTIISKNTFHEKFHKLLGWVARVGSAVQDKVLKDLWMTKLTIFQKSFKQSLTPLDSQIEPQYKGQFAKKNDKRMTLLPF